MDNSYLIINVPKDISISGIASFVERVNCIFKFKGLKRSHFILNFERVAKADVLGVLLTYKILEYGLVHKCFFHPQHNLNFNKYLSEEVERYGFKHLIDELSSTKNELEDVKEKSYKALKVEMANDCLIAPIALIRSDMSHSDDVIRNQYEPIVTNYYKSNPKVVDMILEVFTEIMNNFWSHATDDKSIIVGYGNKSKFEIACTDNGIGIDGTVKMLLPKLKGEQALQKAMEDGFTSKKNTNHMGYGLWFVNQIVKRTNGLMLVISNNSFYQNKGGKIFVGNSPCWEGTAVYIKLPLLNPVTINDIEKDRESQNIKINFI